MTPENASVILSFLCGTLENEIKTTRSLLAAVPDDKADYTPHPTSMTAMRLATHLATGDIWFLESILNGAFDMAGESAGPKFTKPSELVALYDEKMPALLAQVKAMPGEKIAASFGLGEWVSTGI